MALANLDLVRSIVAAWALSEVKTVSAAAERLAEERG